MELLNELSVDLVNLLPKSPFKPFIEGLKNGPLNDYMGYVNWFIPFNDFITIMEGWLVVISIFYIYSVIMRWVKLIGD